MKVRVRNKVYLKKNLDEHYFRIPQFEKIVELIKILIPNHKRVYADIRDYCVDCLERDTFDIYLYHFIAGPGYVIKIKELKNGIWMTREPRGVCYIYEPKSKTYRDQIEEESVEWLKN